MPATKHIQAITREISPTFIDCELTHVERCPIDLGRARRQHQEYVDTLAKVGCEVTALPALPEFPDAVFVEDVAVVLETSAVLTRPGAASRRGEVASMVEVLQPFRQIIHTIVGPGTLDGGDVLVAGSTIFIGLSTRTNRAGADQLAEIALAENLTPVLIPLTNCLHLKSAATLLNREQILLNPSWIAAEHFDDFQIINVDRHEPGGANALTIKDAVLYPMTAYPRTTRIIEDHLPPQMMIHPIDNAEMRKAEGALTCCSLIFEV